MPELDADFEISTNNLEAEYEISEGQHFDCSFEIYASGTTWGSITGNIEEQTDLQDIFSDLRSNIDDIADDLSIEIDNRQSADIDLQDNIDTLDNKIDTHIADKINPHEVTKAQIGLGNVDNTSDLNKPISTATQTALNGKQNTINDLSEIRTNASNGQSAYNTIQTFGDIVTYDASNFATSAQGQKADTALQPNDNITELNNNAGYITSASLPTVNNSTITFQKNNVTVGDFNLNQSNNETINFDIPTTASDVNALPDTTTINDLTTTAQQNAINSGATSDNIGQIATNTSNLNSLQSTVTNNYNTLDDRITSEVSTLNTVIGTEATNRQNADSNLQSQIDAIVSSSDVFDIVGTYAELQAYDISTVPVNDIIKVLVDSTHFNAATYYRCVESDGVKSWSYIGSEGAYYTKSEADSLFVDKTTTVNGKALLNNITLTATDVGALPSSTTIGSGILTIQNNGVDVDTFNANATSNKTINIITPTKTSDLINNSGFIDSSALSGLATQTDLTNGLATKQDTISDLSTIRSNAANGQSAYTTIGGYGDIVTHNTSEFATSAQGNLADTSIQPNDNISLLNNNAGFITGIDSTDVITALGYTPYNSTNPNGYTSNVGTVTSINNTQPDANGNVTIQTGGATDVQINSTSITNQGVANILTQTAYDATSNKIATMSDLPADEIFVATYGVTTLADIITAFNAGKLVYCINNAVVSYLYTLTSTFASFTTPMTSEGVVTWFIRRSTKWESGYNSFANTRFDGQWVAKYLDVASNTAINSYTHSLSTYLPNDSQAYEIFVRIGCNTTTGSSGGSGDLVVGTISSPATNNNSGYSISLRVSTNSTQARAAIILPIASNVRNFYSQISEHKMANTFIVLCGYRRIGTNT